MKRMFALIALTSIAHLGCRVHTIPATPAQPTSLQTVIDCPLRPKRVNITQWKSCVPKVNRQLIMGFSLRFVMIRLLCRVRGLPAVSKEKPRC